MPECFHLDVAAVSQMVTVGRFRQGVQARLVMMRRSNCKTKLAFLWKILPQPAKGIYLIHNHSQTDGD